MRRSAPTSLLRPQRTPTKTSSSSSSFALQASLLQGDNMFRVHSLSAFSFGALLLFAPELVPGTSLATAFAYQQWAIFILAISAIAFAAPSFEDKAAKRSIATTLMFMCGLETLLYGKEILSSLSSGSINAPLLAIDGSSAAVFLFLALGYKNSGLVGGGGIVRAKKV